MSSGTEGGQPTGQPTGQSSEQSSEQPSEQSSEQPSEHDVVAVLLRQHARIRDLFRHVRDTGGEHRKQTFDELRALLAAHETAEEMILRPFTAVEGGKDVADTHNAEEKDAGRVLAELERMDVDSAAFDPAFAAFEKAVLVHAWHEEENEVPLVHGKVSRDQRAGRGRAVLALERGAPTHPHPSMPGAPAAQWAVGPFVSLLDRAKDAVRASTS